MRGVALGEKLAIGDDEDEARGVALGEKLGMGDDEDEGDKDATEGEVLSDKPKEGVWDGEAPELGESEREGIALGDMPKMGDGEDEGDTAGYDGSTMTRMS